MSDGVPLDVVGIGIGPFNLGLAALGASIPGLRLRCFDRRPRFDWHPGMLIEGSVLQVPFLADLVTPADPTNRYSFLSYLKQTGRLYTFAIREAHTVSRKQYNQYCRWVSDQLPSLEYGTEILSVAFEPERGLYRVQGRTVDGGAPVRVYARHVVVGVGSVPKLPACVSHPLPRGALHSAEYLSHREALLQSGSVLVVGSGQSAAEIVLDLVEHKPDGLDVTWLTRSERFFPMDTSKLALEMASPDYVDHFHRLAPERRREVLARQDMLYKGISAETIGRIYDLLHDRGLDGPRDDVHLGTSAQLERLRADVGGLVARFRHLQLDSRFDRRADHVVLATGYGYPVPAFLDPVLAVEGARDARGALRIGRDYSLRCEGGGVYVQNAELETHGFTASDLSLGPYRNSVILNAICGRPHFLVEPRTAVQDFGLPAGAEPLREEPREELPHLERPPRPAAIRTLETPS